MANAIPVHEKKEEAPKKAPKVEQNDAPKALDYHPEMKPGNFYKLPDGTVCKDN